MCKGVNTLTTSGAITGTIQIGQLLTGTGVGNRTYIVSGSGTSWTVSNALSVASTTMTATCYKAGATFTGSVGGGGGTTLTVSSAVVGTIQIGQYLYAVSGASTGNAGVASGTYIVSGSGTTWTLNQNAGTTTANTPLATTAVIPTAFQTTFASTSTSKNATFYNSSTRLNTGDRAHLVFTPSTSPALAGVQDLTAQIDLF